MGIWASRPRLAHSIPRASFYHVLEVLERDLGEGAAEGLLDVAGVVSDGDGEQLAGVHLHGPPRLFVTG
jgi:hypothetical protein